MAKSRTIHGEPPHIIKLLIIAHNRGQVQVKFHGGQSHITKMLMFITRAKAKSHIPRAMVHHYGCQIIDGRPSSGSAVAGSVARHVEAMQGKLYLSVELRTEE